MTNKNPDPSPFTPEQEKQIIEQEDAEEHRQVQQDDPEDEAEQEDATGNGLPERWDGGTT